MALASGLIELSYRSSLKRACFVFGLSFRQSLTINTRFNPISVLTVTRSLAIFILSIIKLCFWWPPCCIVLCTVINDAWGLNKTTTERRWLVITSIQIVDITVHQQSDTTYTIQYCTRHVAKSKPQQRSNCPQQAHDEKAFKSERPNYLSWRHREQSATFNTALRTRRAL